jgi:hypothetical protein
MKTEIHTPLIPNGLRVTVGTKEMVFPLSDFTEDEIAGIGEKWKAGLIAKHRAAMEARQKLMGEPVIRGVE